MRMKSMTTNDAPDPHKIRWRPRKDDGPAGKIRVPWNLKRWDNHKVEKHIPTIDELNDFIGDCIHQKGKLHRQVHVTKGLLFDYGWGLDFVCENGCSYVVSDAFVKILKRGMQQADRYGAFILYRAPFSNRTKLIELYYSLVKQRMKDELNA